MPVTIGNSAGATAIRPFTVPKVPEAELEALRARIAAAAGVAASYGGCDRGAYGVRDCAYG